MNDQQKKTVYEIICQHPEGVLARRVAYQMGITRSEVNSYLYSYEGLELFEQNPDDHTWCLKEKLPASALLRVAVTHGDKEEVFTVVSDARDQKTDSGIYWMERELAIRILTAVHMERDVFLHNNKEYKILRTCKTGNYDDIGEKLFYFLNADFGPKTVFISKQINFINEDQYEPITALFYYAGGSYPAQMTVYYSETDGKYYIDEITYQNFRRRYGLPYVSLESVPGEHYANPAFLADMSPLFLYGYNVREGETSLQERRSILARLMDYKLMEKIKIHNYLCSFINRNETNPGMENAVEKWKEDLAFVDEYHMVDQRTVWVSSFAAR